MSDRQPVTGRTRDLVISLQKLILVLSRFWVFIAIVAAMVILAMAFLAPAFMASGQPEAGQAIYRFLAPHNHQLPQRSYFLFGQAGGIQTYSLDQVLAWGGDANNLQAFVGNAEIGFKTALNHRMVAIFAGLCLGGLIWQLAGERPRLRFVPFLLTVLPIVIDGLSHANSETSGRSYRQTNDWAHFLTGGLFPGSFYEGTIIGTLNWLLRTGTGFIFGLGLAWFLFTYLSNRFSAIRRELVTKLRKAGAIKRVGE